MASKMFPFITCTWNPLGGECRHGCVYCWARKLAAERKMAKYEGEPRLIGKELRRKFKPNDFVFVCDMLDLFGDWVPGQYVVDILDVVGDLPEIDFLLLTKNPRRYLELLDFLRVNVVLGCTIESDHNYSAFSKAPEQSERLYWMKKLADAMDILRIKKFAEKKLNALFVSIEPILDFSLLSFENDLVDFIRPWAVAVGYDNYNNHLPEPPLAKTLQLIEALEKAGIKVFRKTLREAWDK